MKAEIIYHTLKGIAEPIDSYDDQLVAFAHWIENEFTYNPLGARIERVMPKLLESCFAAKAMYEAQGVNESSRIGGEQYKNLLEAIKQATE